MLVRQTTAGWMQHLRVTPKQRGDHFRCSNEHDAIRG